MEINKIRSEKIKNLEKIKIDGDPALGTKTIFVQYSGFIRDNKFCFYCYDENQKNGALIYLSRFSVRILINSGKINL